MSKIDYNDLKHKYRQKPSENQYQSQSTSQSRSKSDINAAFLKTNNVVSNTFKITAYVLFGLVLIGALVILAADDMPFRGLIAMAGIIQGFIVSLLFIGIAEIIAQLSNIRK